MCFGRIVAGIYHDSITLDLGTAFDRNHFTHKFHKMRGMVYLHGRAEETARFNLFDNIALRDSKLRAEQYR